MEINKLIDPDFYEKVEDKSFLKYILYGDTDSLFIYIPDPGDTKHCIRVAAECSKDINDLIIKYNTEYLLPRCGYAKKHNQTTFKEEMIIESIMFIAAKKTYAYKLLAKEAQLDETGKLVKGTILDEPEINPTSNLGVKTDSIKFSKLILDKLLETALDRNIKPNDRMKITIDIINSYHKQFKEEFNQFKLENVSKPAKWAKNEQIIMGMKLYNSIIENIFEPSSAGRFIYCKFKNINKIKQLNLDFDISKLNGITIPYSYNPEIIKKSMDSFEIIFDEEEQWEKVLNSTCEKVLDLFKETSK